MSGNEMIITGTALLIIAIIVFAAAELWMAYQKRKIKDEINEWEGR